MDFAKRNGHIQLNQYLHTLSEDCTKMLHAVKQVPSPPCTTITQRVFVGTQCLLLQRNVTAIERLAQTPFGPELLMARDTTTWQTALQLACSPGASEVVQVLLQASADVSAREPSRSWTALHVAADRGCDVPTLQMLLEVVLPLSLDFASPL